MRPQTFNFKHRTSNLKPLTILITGGAGFTRPPRQRA